MDILNDIKRTFKTGGILTQLIIINVAVFFAVNVIDILLMLFVQQLSETFSIVDWFSVPSSLENLIFKPWTPLSYMFLHKDLMHLAINMLWLYWFGKLFIHFIGKKQILTVYIYGGLAGAAIFIVIFNVLPYFTPFVGSPMLGASAAVMAVVLAVAFYQPDYEINLMLVGQVKLKYIALITIALDVLFVFGNNAGGHLAHLGGALLGYYFIKDYRNGNDWSIGFDKFTKKIIAYFSSDKKMKVVYKKGNAPRNDMNFNKMKHDDEKRLNEILDKISKYGYKGLSKEEKEFLFKQGKK